MMKFRLPKTRRYRIYIYIVSTLLVLLAVDLAWVRVWRHITVSEETTGITSPLKADGTPDYLQYIDDRAREGVTAENNAFIPYLEVLTEVRGTTPAGKPIILKGYYERFGLTPPMAARELVYFSKILQDKKPPEEYSDERIKEEDFVRKNPWAPAEHPDFVAWLAANEKVLNQLPRITTRPRWYAPVLRPQSGLLIAVLLPNLGQLRELGKEAITRAMMEIHEGRFAEAQADIMAVHRLARLEAQGWTLIDFLVAVAIDNAALEADAALAASPGLPREQLQKFIVEWDALAPWPSMTTKLDLERYGTLDCLIYAAKHPKEASSMLEWDMFTGQAAQESAVPEWLIALGRALRPAHFNAALRDAKGFMDQYAEAGRAGTAILREDRMAVVTKAVVDYDKRYSGPLADPARHMVTQLIPSMQGFVVRCDVREMNAGLARVALALAAYRVDNGGYPDSLGVLAPKYIATVPLDIFNEQPLHYRKTDAGYLLYSVGVNRTDDGGKPPGVGRYTQNDLVVQVPR